MSTARPIEHSIFPSFLQNHSVMRRGLNLADPDVFERFLRYNALFSRSLVIADSDLNNNVVFHNASRRSDSSFWHAVRTGFLRRAPREDDQGNRLSQADVAEGLRKSSKPRFEMIPAGYPADLDAAIKRAPEEGAAVVWTLQRVNRAFGSKLLALLKAAEADQSQGTEIRRMIAAVAGWVTEQRSNKVSFGAADIESQLKPRPSRGSAEVAAWDAVWPLVLQAHTGNIPLVFDGRLAVTGLPETNDRMLPAGPESGPEESAIEARLYAGGEAAQSVTLEVRHLDTELPWCDINEELIMELSLEQVEELRESAVPDLFLDEHFRTAGSAQDMTAGMDGLRQAALAYIERLASAGVLLTAKAQRARLHSDFWGPSGGTNESQIIARAGSADRAVEYAMIHSFPLPGMGPQVLGCDFTWLLSQVNQEGAQSFLGGRTPQFWAYKRPDFRVVEYLGG